MEAVFETKIIGDMSKNGKKVKIIEKKNDRYLVEFEDGERIWAYGSELDFGY